jgi:hypothetical protein
MTEENIRQMNAITQNLHQGIDFTSLPEKVKSTATDAIKIIQNSIGQFERQVLSEIDPKATTEENIRKLNAITQNVHQAIDQAAAKVIDKMKTLNQVDCETDITIKFNLNVCLVNDKK